MATVIPWMIILSIYSASFSTGKFENVTCCNNIFLSGNSFRQIFNLTLWRTLVLNTVACNYLHVMSSILVFSSFSSFFHVRPLLINHSTLSDKRSTQTRARVSQMNCTCASPAASLPPYRPINTHATDRVLTSCEQTLVTSTRDVCA